MDLNKFFLGLFVSMLFFSNTLLKAGEIAVIVNKDLGVGSLSRDQVKAYFLKKETTFGDGSKVLPVDFASNTAERTAFLSKVLEMSPEDTDRYWIEQGYASGTKPPKKASGDPEVVNLVGSTKGAFGFVNASSLKDGAAKNVKKVFAIPF